MSAAPLDVSPTQLIVDPQAKRVIELLLARVSELEADVEELMDDKARERRRYKLTRRFTD